MARHYDLTRVRLEVDDAGFILGGLPDNDRTVISGLFDTPETITARFLRNDVINSYTSQSEVVACVVRGNPDAYNKEKEVIEATFILKPGANWFELDHTVFNEVYMVSV